MEWEEWIRSGKSGEMTEFALKLSSSEIEEVVAYLQSLK